MRSNVTVKMLSEDLTVPLCLDTTGKRLQLVRFENVSKDRHTVITVTPGNRKFGIPPEGIFHCVMCDAMFVQPIQTLLCYDKSAAYVRDGCVCYDFDRDRLSCMPEKSQPIYRNFFGLDYAGNICLWGYRFPFGENGYPVVYIRDSIGVDSDGLLTVPVEDWPHVPRESRFMIASDRGQLCITSDRRILCRGEYVLNGERALDVCTCFHGYLVLTVDGETRFSTNGVGWQVLDDHAVAVSASANTVAIADRHGAIHIYQHNAHALCACGKLSFPDRHISEIAVSDETVIVKFTDCSFDILDWKTGKTCLDDVVFTKP